MNFLHGYPSHMGMLYQSASALGLGDYDVAWAKTHPQYRTEEIAKYK